MADAPWLKEWRSSAGGGTQVAHTSPLSFSSSRYQRGPAEAGLSPEAGQRDYPHGRSHGDPHHHLPAGLCYGF